MAFTRLTAKTLDDKKTLLSKSPYSLPDNPSDKNFNAHQIRVKMYEGLLVLFEWLQHDENKLNDIIQEIENDNNLIKSGGIVISQVDKAVKDQLGNVIDTTYETKLDATAKQTGLQTQITNIVNGVTSVANALNADVATKALKDNLNRDIETTYALALDVANIISGTTPVGKANKATGDKDGNQIDTTYQKISQKGVASGYAELDTNGKVPLSQMYDIIKQIIEYPTLADFPAVGASETIYVAQDTHKAYMWSGSIYVPLEASLVIGTISGTAFDGARGLATETLANNLSPRVTSLESSVALKQNANDSSLLTTVKTIVGAINELYSGKQNNLTSDQQLAVNSGITNTKRTAYDDHIANTILHISAGDRAYWNAKADGGAFAEYTKTANLGRVALTNSYTDLINKLDVQVDGTSVVVGSVANIVLSTRYASAVALANEVTARTNAVAEINGKIPSTASTTNLLVDLATLNDKLTQYSATFRGTFNSLSELQALTGMDINDTANVQRTDTGGNVFYDRYHYNGTSWIFEFTINTTTFTTNQWNAINSGATATIISNTLAHMADTTIHISGSTPIQNIPIIGSSAPTSSTVGIVGQLYINSTDGKVYYCSAVSGSTYTWVLTTGSVELDDTSLIKNGSGKATVSYGGKYIESRGSFMNDFTAGTAEDDNIYNIESAGAVSISKIEEGNRIVGTYAIGATEYEVDQVAHELTVTGVNTGTTYTGVGFTLFYDAVSGENVYILFINNSQYMLAKETDDVSTLLTDITSLQLKVLTIDSEYIKPEVLPLSNAFYHITTTGVITPILDTLINRTSTTAPTTKAVGEAIKTITDLISSSASSSNKLLSASEIDQKIALVEARQLYKTNTQGSFATKAELTGATTFYDASGTSVTPTENDVAYVLADETHDSKTAKYTVASVVGTTVTWAFVIAFTDLQLTEAQQSAINSGITSAKVQIIDNLTTNFLRTDGSNGMSGTINSSAYVAVCGTNVNAYTAMECGTEGGRLVLYGSGYEANRGGFAILAVGPATNCALQGWLDGTLTWNDKNVITSAGGTINNNLTVIGNLISGTDASVVRSDNSHEAWLIGGTNYQNGSSFRASGKDSSLGGKFQCIARNATATKTLEGSPDGTCKWDGNSLLTEATGYTQSQVNTKLTNGSVTKVGTATKGSATQPIYLNAGVPTVCNAYSLGTWNNVAWSGSSGVVIAPISGITFSTASGHMNKYRQDTLGRIEVSLRTTITTTKTIGANDFLNIGTINKTNGGVDVWAMASIYVGSKYYALPFHISSGGAVYLSNTTSSALSLSGAQMQVTFFTA